MPLIDAFRESANFIVQEYYGLTLQEFEEQHIMPDKQYVEPTKTITLDITIKGKTLREYEQWIEDGLNTLSDSKAAHTTIEESVRTGEHHDLVDFAANFLNIPYAVGREDITVTVRSETPSDDLTNPQTETIRRSVPTSRPQLRRVTLEEFRTLPPGTYEMSLKDLSELHGVPIISNIGKTHSEITKLATDPITELPSQAPRDYPDGKAFELLDEMPYYGEEPH